MKWLSTLGAEQLKLALAQVWTLNSRTAQPSIHTTWASLALAQVRTLSLLLSTHSKKFTVVRLPFLKVKAWVKKFLLAGNLKFLHWLIGVRMKSAIIKVASFQNSVNNIIKNPTTLPSSYSTSQGSGIPMEPGRNRPAERSSKTRRNPSTSESGSSPTKGITAQWAWERERERERDEDFAWFTHSTCTVHVCLLVCT